MASQRYFDPAADDRFTTWEFTDLGYGVALAVRGKV